MAARALSPFAVRVTPSVGRRTGRQAGQRLDFACGDHSLYDFLSINRHVAGSANAKLHAPAIDGDERDHDVIVDDDRLSDFARKHEHERTLLYRKPAP